MIFNDTSVVPPAHAPLGRFPQENRWQFPAALRAASHHHKAEHQ